MSNTFIPEQIIIYSSEEPLQIALNTHKLMTMAEEELFGLYKVALKQMKPVFGQSVDEAMTQILSYKPLLTSQKMARQLIDKIDKY